MMQLDFTKLKGIAYRGFETEEAKATKDEWIEQGFSIIEGEKTPFDEPPQQLPAEPRAASKGRQLKPLKSVEGRDYRAMYRAACNFHEKYNPPQLSEAYWSAACDEMCEISRSFNNDPFLTGLLLTVFDELEGEYKRLRQAAEAGPRSLQEAAEG